MVNNGFVLEYHEDSIHGDRIIRIKFTDQWLMEAYDALTEEERDLVTLANEEGSAISDKLMGFHCLVLAMEAKHLDEIPELKVIK